MREVILSQVTIVHFSLYPSLSILSHSIRVLLTSKIIVKYPSITSWIVIIGLDETLCSWWWWKSCFTSFTILFKDFENGDDGVNDALEVDPFWYRRMLSMAVTTIVVLEIITETKERINVIFFMVVFFSFLDEVDVPCDCEKNGKCQTSRIHSTRIWQRFSQDSACFGARKDFWPFRRYVFIDFGCNKERLGINISLTLNSYTFWWQGLFSPTHVSKPTCCNKIEETLCCSTNTVVFFWNLYLNRSFWNARNTGTYGSQPFRFTYCYGFSYYCFFSSFLSSTLGECCRCGYGCGDSPATRGCWYRNGFFTIWKCLG